MPYYQIWLVNTEGDAIPDSVSTVHIGRPGNLEVTQRDLVVCPMHGKFRVQLSPFGPSVDGLDPTGHSVVVCKRTEHSAYAEIAHTSDIAKPLTYKPSYEGGVEFRAYTRGFIKIEIYQEDRLGCRRELASLRFTIVQKRNTPSTLRQAPERAVAVVVELPRRRLRARAHGLMRTVAATARASPEVGAQPRSDSDSEADSYLRKARKVQAERDKLAKREEATRRKLQQLTAAQERDNERRKCAIELYEAEITKLMSH